MKIKYENIQVLITHSKKKLLAHIKYFDWHSHRAVKKKYNTFDVITLQKKKKNFDEIH